MSKVVSITNFKGGVGKTTSAVNLGSALSRLGKNVLLVDLDPQFNLTSHLNGDIEKSNLAKLLITGRNGDGLYYEQHSPNLFLAPAHYNLTSTDIEMAGIIAGREMRLKKVLDPLRDHFDYIIIDCPPNLGILPYNAYFASDIILVPVETEILPLQGYGMLHDALENLEMQIDGVFMTKHDARKRMHKDIALSLQDNLGEVVFKTKIRHNVALAEAPAAMQSVLDYASDSYGAEDYMKLGREFLERFK